MEQHLITMNIWHRVDPTPDAITKAVIHAGECRHTLALLGLRGSCTLLVGNEVGRFTHEQYAKAAQLGLLYTGKDEDRVQAFAPDIDGNTGLPLLMEEFGFAFRKRSLAGAAATEAEQQPQLPLGS